MSIHIDPTGTTGAAAVDALTSSAASPTTSPDVTTTDEAAVTVQIGSASAVAGTSATSMPDSPPPSVLQAISAASDAYERLAAAGQHVSFSTDPQTGELHAALESDDGSTESISGSEAIALAQGESL